MSRGLVVVWSKPFDGSDAEYHEWYRTVHLPEVVSLVPSVRHAARYGPHSSLRTTQSALDRHRYLSVYEVDGGIESVAGEFAAAVPRFKQPGPAVDKDSIGGMFYELMWGPFVGREPETHGSAADSTRTKKEGTMPAALLLVWSRPLEGQDEEYTQWYNEEHLPEALSRVPGFHSVRRFRPHSRLRTTQPGMDGRNLAVYEIDADVEAVKTQLGEALKTFTQPYRGVDNANVEGVFYELVYEFHEPASIVSSAMRVDGAN